MNGFVKSEQQLTQIQDIHAMFANIKIWLLDSSFFNKDLLIMDIIGIYNPS